MSEPFRVGLTRDFLKPDGTLGFSDIGLDLLDRTPGVTWEFMGEDTRELRADQVAGYDALLALAPRITAATLQDARVVTAGAHGLVDRVSEHGADVARALAATFEQTAYARDYFDADVVPVEVLRDLGAATCLCTVPSRSDHDLLLDTFFGSPLPSPAWEERRRHRVESLTLLLEFHAQRPTSADDDLFAWRRALLDPRFSDGTTWSTSHPERLQFALRDRSFAGERNHERRQGRHDYLQGCY